MNQIEFNWHISRAANHSFVFVLISSTRRNILEMLP